MRITIAAVLLILASLSVLAQEPTTGANYAMTHEPSMLMRSKHFDYDHEIRVSLPASYSTQPDTRYPVFWVTDGSFGHDMTVGIVNLLSAGQLCPEMIVVSVGAPNSTGMAGMARRNSEFAPPGDRYLFDGPGADFMYSQMESIEVDLDAYPQKGREFLSFFIDEVRPALAEKYRFNGDHGLFGHSGGGMFTAYALFERPGAFNKYLIGSPSINATDKAILRMEAEYAETHDDMAASVFLAAGGAELNNITMAAWGIVSSPAVLAETLLIRQYPSLKVTGRMYDQRNHFDVLPILLTDGIVTLYGPDVPAGPIPMAE